MSNWTLVRLEDSPPRRWPTGRGRTRVIWDEPLGGLDSEWSITVEEVKSTGGILETASPMDLILTGWTGPQVSVSWHDETKRLGRGQSAAVPAGSAVKIARGLAAGRTTTRLLSVATTPASGSADVHFRSVDGEFSMHPEARAIAVITGTVQLDGLELSRGEIAVSGFGASLDASASKALVLEVCIASAR